MTLWEARIHQWSMIIGILVLMPLWLTNRISDRAMLGITLFLSLYSPAIEARNGIRLAKNKKEQDG